jgi:hypothetical protein
MNSPTRKGIKHHHKKTALIEYAKSVASFTTQEAVDFLNSYRSKTTGNLHRYTRTTQNQLGSLLSSDKDYIQVDPNKSRHVISTWKYIGEEE